MARPDPEKLAKALRTNLRRRKSAPAQNSLSQAPESPESAAKSLGEKPSEGQG